MQHCGCTSCSESIAVLGLKSPVSFDEIHSTYRDLIKVWHPDRFEHDPRLRNRAEEQFKKIQEAFNSLREHQHIQSTNPKSNKHAHASTPGAAGESEGGVDEAIDQPFLMPIEYIFSISGRGTVAVGRIKYGKIRVGEEVQIAGFGRMRKTVVTGIEMFRKSLDEALPGDNVGLLLQGIRKEELEPGMALIEPGSI